MESISRRKRLVLLGLGLVVASLVFFGTSFKDDSYSNTVISKIISNDYHLKGKAMSFGRLSKKIINLYD